MVWILCPWFCQVFVVAVLATFLLVPRNLSHQAYRLSFLGTACSSLYFLYSLHGVMLTFFLPFIILFKFESNDSGNLEWCLKYVFPFFFFGSWWQKPSWWNLQAIQTWLQTLYTSFTVSHLSCHSYRLNVCFVPSR